MRLRLITMLAAAVGLVASACGGQTLALEAAGPFAYPAPVTPAAERVAILVTVANRTTDDLPINPADFLVRDAEHRIYTSNPTATLADAQVVHRDMAPLPTVTLRQDDVVSGFVVFDVPVGVHPVEVIFRQSDTDHVVSPAPTP